MVLSATAISGEAMAVSLETRSSRCTQFGGISLFLPQAVTEDVTLPPPGQWVGIFLFPLMLGPVLLYLYAKAARV